MKEIWTQT